MNTRGIHRIENTLKALGLREVEYRNPGDKYFIFIS
jgi:hypothetical protein